MDVASEKNNSAPAGLRTWPNAPTAWPRATMFRKLRIDVFTEWSTELTAAFATAKMQDGDIFAGDPVKGGTQ